MSWICSASACRKWVLVAISWMAMAVTAVAVEQREIDAPPAAPGTAPGAMYWPSEAPADCPFTPSDKFKALRFTGRHAEYTGADTWYPSWAADGNMYSPWTDGKVNDLECMSCTGPDAATGYATIIGDDPLKLQVTNQGKYSSSASPYGGRYPCGSLVYNGVWYYGTYCLHNASPVHEGVTYNWAWLGPFVGFRYSTDLGKTWTQTPCTPEKPLFGENGLEGQPVKLGSPHFVDFGKNMEHSPDGKAYLVCHGASDPDPKPRFANASWITGDQIYLIRVTPSIENINDASKYEFFAGRDAAGAAIWSNDFGKIKPIAEWNNNMGCVTMTYNAPLKKYIMCVTDGTNTTGYYNTYLLESDQIAGPWKLVTYMRHFGEQAYFVNIPSKFISGDGRTFWLCYAANFSTGWNGVNFLSRPAGGRYAMSLQEVKLGSTTDPVNPLESDDNVAIKAIVSVTSTHPGYRAEGAIDAIVGGFPKDQNEWASHGNRETGMIRLTWSEPQTIDRVWLFDRPNDLDQIISAMLVFSDGTTIPVGTLPDDAQKGIEVKFDPKTVQWVTLIVTGVKRNTQNVGLSEIAVFRAPSAATPTK